MNLSPAGRSARMATLVAVPVAILLTQLTAGQAQAATAHHAAHRTVAHASRPGTAPSLVQGVPSCPTGTPRGVAPVPAGPGAASGPVLEGKAVGVAPVPAGPGAASGPVLEGKAVGAAPVAAGAAEQVGTPAVAVAVECAPTS